MTDDTVAPFSQYWATLVREGAAEHQIRAVIAAVNDLTASHQANRAAVIVACAQILGQNISGEPEVAREIRAAIMLLVDGFAMHSAVIETE